jgi:protein tyrosine phosphatase
LNIKNLLIYIACFLEKGEWVMIMKILFKFLLSCSIGLYAGQSLNRHLNEHIGWTSMYSLSQFEIDKHFKKVQEEVNWRWDLLVNDNNFSNYHFNKVDSEIIDEFYRFSNLRINLWLENYLEFPCQSNKLFKISQSHQINRRFRQPNCITFEHSATDYSYNSSSIQIGKRRFFALEGPVKNHVLDFYRLLVNWNVSYLVCLTDEKDQKGNSKCFPYWRGNIFRENNDSFLNIRVEGSYENPVDQWGIVSIPYVFWPDWEDHHGVDPEKLVEMANLVRKKTAENEIVAVHCSAGVGRTGTFISAICILDAIDEQLEKGTHLSDIKLSIAEIFMYLNFYRPWLIAKPSQYVTLYRLVDYYLNQIENENIL